MIAKTGQMFRFIAMDVGFIIPTENRDDWTYICTRLLDLLKRYYSQLTLSEVKLAFELLITGELDDYLPKDRDGNAERKHYQQFNADYFAKVLNAYCRKQNQVIGKAYTALPEPKKELSPEQIRYYRNQSVMTCLMCFMRYKYTGRLVFGLTDEMFVYNWLLGVGLADEVKETEDDRKEAYNRFWHVPPVGSLMNLRFITFVNKEPKARKLIIQPLRLPGVKRLNGLSTG